jgi:hypothetical protein
MGLWDLAAGAGGLARVRTPLAARYRELAAAGGTAAGRLVVPDERSALVP